MFAVSFSVIITSFCHMRWEIVHICAGLRHLLLVCAAFFGCITSISHFLRYKSIRAQIAGSQAAFTKCLVTAIARNPENRAVRRSGTVKTFSSFVRGFFFSDLTLLNTKFRGDDDGAPQHDFISSRWLSVSKLFACGSSC